MFKTRFEKTGFAHPYTYGGIHGYRVILENFMSPGEKKGDIIETAFPGRYRFLCER